MPKLIITTEVQGKIAYEFTEKLITIGRATDNVLPLADKKSSRKHAKIERVGDEYLINDLGSGNGSRAYQQKNNECESDF